MSTEKRRPWWIIFPMQGLRISSRELDITKPMFGDATVISKQHLEKLIRAIKPNLIAQEQNQEAIAIHALSDSFKSKQADSFLIVRCMADVSTKEGTEEAVSYAKKRAYQVATALSLLWLAQSPSNMGHTCALSEDLHWNIRGHSLLTLEEGKWGTHWAADQPLFSYDSWPLSRAKLLRVMRQPSFRGIYDALLIEKPIIRGSLHDAIEGATRSLYEAIHSLSASPRLLGAVISMEVLVSYESQAKYEQIERRVNLLVGTEASEYYNTHAVFKARSAYVHRGKEIEDEGLQRRAIALALTCLLRYAEAAHHFTNKPSFIAYLDFIDKAQAIEAKWTEAEQRAFSKLVKHKPGAYQFWWV